MTRFSTKPFEHLFALPLRNGLTRPKAVRGCGVKMVNMGEIFAHSRIADIPMARVPLSDREAESYLLQPGDLLFARQSLVLSGAGKCSVFVGEKEPVTFEGHLIRARLNRQVADPHFYFYFFNSPRGRDTIETIVEQVAAAGIRGSDLAKLAVPHPPVETQRAIALVLGSLDDKIELNWRMNETLEALAQSLFKSWFVDTTQAVLPKGWRVSTLREHVELRRGNTYKSALKDLPGPYLLGLASIHRNGGFRRGSLSTYGGESSPNILLRPGDLYVSLKDVTQSADLLGAVARIPPDIEQGRLTQDTVKLVFKNTAISTNYVYRLLRTPEYREFCRAHATGTTNLGLSREDFLSYQVIIAPDEVQRKFDSTAEALERRFDVNDAESRTLAALRDALLPKLLSGELRVAAA